LNSKENSSNSTVDKAFNIGLVHSTSLEFTFKNAKYYDIFSLDIPYLFYTFLINNIDERVD